MSFLCLLLLAACTQPTMSSNVRVEKLDSDQYLVQIKIERAEELLCAPSLLCLAGEKAQMQLTDEGTSLTIDISAPAPGEIDALDIQVALIEAGREPVRQRIEVVAGTSGTVTCPVD